MPLIETVTDPDMVTPWEVAEVGQLIRWLARVSGLVRTGPGAGRQDVNVSVTGGTRIEIKGVPSLRDIPRLVHNEALRQTSLVAIQRELQRRGVTEADLLRPPLRRHRQRTRHRVPQREQGHRQGRDRARGATAGLRGPDHRATPSRARPCSRSSATASASSPASTTCPTWPARPRTPTPSPVASGTRSAASAAWTPPCPSWWSGAGEEDAETAAREIVIRARDAVAGVPGETRQALDDGTNGFERILPGADRMYPDTDLPPIGIPTSDSRPCRRPADATVGAADPPRGPRRGP